MIAGPLNMLRHEPGGSNGIALSDRLVNVAMISKNSVPRFVEAQHVIGNKHFVARIPNGSIQPRIASTTS